MIARGDRYGDPIAAYVMPPEASVDIDDAFDLRVADLLLRDRESRRPAATAVL